MTLETLETELQLARDEFTALNRKHWRGRWCENYRALHHTQERKLTLLAERIAAMQRIAAYLRIKSLLK